MAYDFVKTKVSLSLIYYKKKEQKDSFSYGISMGTYGTYAKKK